MQSDFFFSTADLPLGSDGEEGVPQLGQDHPHQIEFINVPAAGDGIGQGRDGSGQLTGIHILTSRLSYDAGGDYAQKSAAE